ncbi:MAG: TlpA family protein disulfide reductase [Fimbriiglobus sp.]
MRRSFLILPLALGLAGCQTKITPPASPPADPDSQLPTATRPVELTEVSVAGLDAAVRENRGKVVLLDVWFLGCGPCLKKFPHIVELHRKYADSGLVVMSVDVLPEELTRKDQVLEFLRKQGAAFPNFIIRDDDKVLDAWTEKYHADMTPATVLFDRDGMWVRTPRGQTVEQLELVVRELIAKY